MYSFNKNKKILLQILSDSNFHSGESLGNKIGITRAAVSKSIQSLQQLGFNIFAIKGKGYKLGAKLSLLDPNYFNELSCGRYFEILNVIDSTNNYIMENSDKFKNKGDFCVAEFQSAGRGRRGNLWYSPFASGINLSVFWKFDRFVENHNRISLVVGISVAQVIKSFGIDIKLKWPNDLFVSGQKLGGILVDAKGVFDDEIKLIIGIGINVTTSSNAYYLKQNNISQPWTDLISHLSNGFVNRNELIKDLVNTLEKNFKSFEKDEFKLSENWLKFDYLVDTVVNFQHKNKIHMGVFKGVDDYGKVMIQHSKGIKIYDEIIILK